MTTSRAVVIGALTILPVLWPSAAKAQHHDTKPATAPATAHGPAAAAPAKPAPAAAEKHAAVPAAPPVAAASKPAPPPAAPKREAPHDELKAALARIDLGIKEGQTTSAKAPAKPTVAPVAAAARLPRIRLSWRASVMWPSELDSESSLESVDRISLTWR